MSERLYNLEPLNILVDGNEKFRKYLIELFVQTTPPILEDIKKSLQTEDWDGVYAHTHKLKPTLESMGIFSMKPVANEILAEAKTKTGSQTLKVLVEKLCTTIEEAILQLQTYEL